MAKFSSFAILVQCPVPWQFGTESTFYWIETRRRRRHVHSVMTLPLSVSSSKSKTLLLGIGSVASSSPGVPSSFDVFAVIFMGTRRKEKKKKRWTMGVDWTTQHERIAYVRRVSVLLAPLLHGQTMFNFPSPFFHFTGRFSIGDWSADWLREGNVSKEIIDFCLISNRAHGAFFLSFFFPDSDEQ